MLRSTDSQRLMESNVTNFSQPECLVEIQPLSWELYSYNGAGRISTILAVAVNFLTMPFTVFLNALIMYVVWKNESLRVERVIVLAYLALTDFLVGLICQPLFIVREVLHLKNEASNCAIDSAFYFIMFLCVGTSFYQLLLVTYERYVAIIHPYQYPTRITVKRLTYATLGFWTLNVFLVVSLLVLSRFASFLLKGPTFLDAAIRALIIICILYFYIHIFVTIRRQIRQIGQQQQNFNQHILQNYKGAITAALLCGVFLFSFAPFLTTIILRHIHESEMRGTTLLLAQPWVFSAVIINSVVNPLIYGIRRRELRRKCLAVLCLESNDNVIFSQNAFVLHTMANTTNSEGLN